MIKNLNKYETKFDTNDISIWGHRPKYDDYSASCHIHWSIDFEHRSWGVKGMMINIHYIMLSVCFINDEKEIKRDFILNDETDITDTYSLKEVDNGTNKPLQTFEIVKNFDNLNDNFYGTISIDDIELNLNDNTFTINL